MRLSDICTLIKANIPQVTPDFGDAQAASIAIASGTVTVTSTAHGLSAGDTFTLSGFSVDALGIDDEIINYSHTVVAITDPDIFTFTIIQSTVTGTASGVLHTNIRVYPTASVSLAVDSYSKVADKTYKKVLYIIDLGETTSKDRSVGNDASFQMTRSTDLKMTFINSFGILAIIPLKNDTVGAAATDYARQLLAYFVASIVGLKLPTDWQDAQSSAISMISSNREQANNAFIVQNYRFETIENITGADANRDDFGYNINDINLIVEPKIGD